MRSIRISASIAAAVCLLGGAAVPGFGFIVDFESGTDWEAIGSTIPGLTFTTPSHGDAYYADINGGPWRFKSDNGTAHPDWEYFISGNVAAVSPDDNTVVINFASRMSLVGMGYSSYFPFTISAYDAGHALLGSQTGERNSREWGGTGLSYLEVSGSGIASVRIFSQQNAPPVGGYWVVDNLSYVPEVVPEWPACLLALPGLAAIRRYFSRG